MNVTPRPGYSAARVRVKRTTNALVAPYSVWVGVEGYQAPTEETLIT